MPYRQMCATRTCPTAVPKIFLAPTISEALGGAQDPRRRQVRTRPGRRFDGGAPLQLKHKRKQPPLAEDSLIFDIRIRESRF